MQQKITISPWEFLTCFFFCEKFTEHSSFNYGMFLLLQWDSFLLSDLSECQLMHVPDAVYHLMRNTELKSCDLSSNVITKITAKFAIKFNLITGMSPTFIILFIEITIMFYAQQILIYHTIKCLNYQMNWLTWQTCCGWICRIIHS